MVTENGNMMNTWTKKLSVVALAGFVALSLSGCTTTTERGASAAADPAEIADPMEKLNRGIFAFNDGLDQVLLKPVAKGYRAVVPQPARTGVRNFLRNLKSPIYVANDVLQGDLSGAANNTGRAVVNTVIGVGGLFDVATPLGLKYQPEDFGQTMATWGVGHGAYAVLPVMGPGSIRDHLGTAVDSYADPVRLWMFNTDREGWHYARLGVTVVDTREEFLDILDDLKKNSIDYYAAVRSTWTQRRAAMVKDEDVTSGVADIPDYQ